LTGPHNPADDWNATSPAEPPPIPQWWDDEPPAGEPERSDGPASPAPVPAPQPGGPRGHRRGLVGLCVAACLLAGAGVVWRADTATPPSVASTIGRATSPAGGPTTSSAHPATPGPTSRPLSTGSTALVVAGTLEVKGRSPVNDYDRALFGQAWLDVDRNGCDTRNDILRRDLRDVVLKPGTHGCAVLTGTLADPYGGNTIDFVRGASTSSLVQIDHVVPLADAWQKGARTWTDERRAQFANDPLNLLAVDGALNQAKSAGDAATWLPPNRAYRCAYAARIVAVKAKYGLWVTQAESDALHRVLRTCPAPPLPTDAG